MKRIVCIAFAMLLMLFSATAGYASVFINPPIVDEAGLIDQGEREFLSEKLMRVRDRYDFDVAIYIEQEMSGESAMETADDIYDYNLYGSTARDYDGAMLYISMNPREYHITTYAYGVYAFTDDGIAYIKNTIQPLLADGDYYDALNAFCDCSEKLLEAAEEGTPYSADIHGDDFYESEEDFWFWVVVLAVLPLIVAFFKMRRQLKKMKTAVAQSYATSYMKEGSKHLSASRDMFLYSTTSRTAKPQASSSSTHTSSSGRRHGGGGGSF